MALFKKALLLSIQYNWVIFYLIPKHVLTKRHIMGHGGAVWNNWSCLRDSKKDRHMVFLFFFFFRRLVSLSVENCKPRKRLVQGPGLCQHVRVGGGWCLGEFACRYCVPEATPIPHPVSVGEAFGPSGVLAFFDLLSFSGCTPASPFRTHRIGQHLSPPLCTPWEPRLGAGVEDAGEQWCQMEPDGFSGLSVAKDGFSVLSVAKDERCRLSGSSLLRWNVSPKDRYQFLGTPVPQMVQRAVKM